MDIRDNLSNSPGVEQLGSFENVNCFWVMHVTMLLPVLRAPVSEHFTSTTVPPVTGNVAVVAIVFLHSTFSPVQQVPAFLDCETSTELSLKYSPVTLKYNSLLEIGHNSTVT